MLCELIPSVQAAGGPRGEGVREDEGDAATALVERRTGMRSTKAAALWIAIELDLRHKSRSCPVRTRQENSQWKPNCTRKKA